MIAKIKGQLVKQEETRIYISSGDIIYEIYVPKTVSFRLKDLCGQPVELVTYHYFHSDKQRLYPVLIGFLSELEREFFEKIIMVSGIGPKAALRALERPISEIAEAIDRGDVQYLKNLPTIGLQRAKNIVALLQGKMGRFTLILDKMPSEVSFERDVHKEIAEEAEQILLQLQYKKHVARQMIDKALKGNPEVDNLEELLTQIYKQRPQPSLSYTERKG